MILRHFASYLMETWTRWCSLRGYVAVFIFLTTASKGSACEAPSSPQCFRRKVSETVYICEWSMNTTESDVTFDFYFNEAKLGSSKKTWTKFVAEQLRTKYSSVNISVKAHVGNSSCMSTSRSVVLGHTVKYEAPQDISISWLKNNLNLSWTAEETHPALAEVRFRPHENSTESWESRETNTTRGTSKYWLVVENLLRSTAYQVQIRQRSSRARHPLWSDWSPVVTVPAELEHKPEFTVTTRLLNGTRKVTLTWKPLPHAAAVAGVAYSLNDTLSSHRCPCQKSRQYKKSNTHVIYVSYSAVNISVTARNTAGSSPPAIIAVPAEPAADLEPCDKTLLDEKWRQRTCLELYELRDGDPRPETVITLMAGKKKEERQQIRSTIKEYVRYLYFEHRCNDRQPQTVKMCLYYQKEGVPLSEPQDFNYFNETHSSVDLSWKEIPSADHRGFLTHYSLCSVKISSQDEPLCHNISAMTIKHSLKNLTPGAKYNISLAGVTRVGEGPKATVTISTLPVGPVNELLLWSFGLLFLFFLISTSCTFILKRIKTKVFPPVPTPVIQPDFTCFETQEMLEKKEEVHELTLLQLHPEGKPVPKDAEETNGVEGEWDDATDDDGENERGVSRMSGETSDEHSSSTDDALRREGEEEMTDLEQLDNEIAMLIYRNGLLFDVKTDSA